MELAQETRQYPKKETPGRTAKHRQFDTEKLELASIETTFVPFLIILITRHCRHHHHQHLPSRLRSTPTCPRDFHLHRQ